ncbi:MAG: hypothetical protein ACXWET_04570 [Halobacteriota archaeon]|jgi:hypothetical protein
MANTAFLDYLGPLLTIVLFLIIILMETLVLRGLKWGSQWASFTDSVIVNIVSALAGVFLFAFSGTALNLGLAPLLLILGTLTVLIEGVILTLMKRHPLRQTWIAAVAINVVSFAFIYVLLSHIT